MNRYNIIILDDEQLIAQGLAQKVDWNSLGCAVAAVGYDGEEGLRLIRELQPHILITDIRMPQRSGLELAEIIQQQGWPVQVVLLTAHDDFQYAKQAIGYNVQGYILKPIDKQEVVDSVQKIVQDLDSRNRMRSEQEMIQKIAEQMRPLLSQAVLFDNVMYGFAPGESMEAYSGLFDEAYRQGVVAVLQAWVGQSTLDELAVFSIYSSVGETLMQAVPKYLIKQVGNRLILIIACTESISLQVFRDRTSHMLEQILQTILVEKRIICHIGLSEPYSSVDNMHLCYQYACELLKKGYYQSCPGVFSHQEMRSETEKPQVEAAIAQLWATVHLGSSDEAEALLVQIRRLLASTRDADYMVDKVVDIANGINRILQDYGELEAEEIDRGAIQLRGSLDSHMALLKEIVRDICTYIKSKQRITGRIRLLVEKRYSETDFNLQLVAEELDLNQSYLSRLFKKEIGIKFTQHLADFRIEKACELLKSTSYRSNEIARLTGFSDERYFSTVFKKKCGITPKKYREKHQK